MISQELQNSRNVFQRRLLPVVLPAEEAGSCDTELLGHLALRQLQRQSALAQMIAQGV
jgi:hypothetical protein